jgi:hypothetical protein
VTQAQEFVVHQDPVWRERSNFAINAELREKDRPRRFEQLFARQLGDDRFEVCLYSVCSLRRCAWRHRGHYAVRCPQVRCQGVVKSSGRYVFRVWFGESFDPRDDVAQELKVLGSLTEWSSRNLLAVDAVDLEHAQKVADFLAESEKAGRLVYETGRS